MTAAIATATTPSSLATDRTGGASKFASDVAVHTRRRLAHIRQVPEKLLDVTIQPLMFVLLFAYVFGGAIAVGDGNYREYVIAGILVQTLTFGLVGPATSIANDLKEGVVDRFRVLPSRRMAYLVGHCLAEMLGSTLGIVILLSSGLIVGWRAHNGVVDTAGALALLLLYTFTMIWVGTLLGILVRSADAVMGLAFVVVFPISFISGCFVPIGTLPGPLQAVASWNPVSLVAASVRSLFGNPSAPLDDPSWALAHATPASVLFCGVLLAVLVPTTLHRFVRRTTE